MDTDDKFEKSSNGNDAEKKRMTNSIIRFPGPGTLIGFQSLDILAEHAFSLLKDDNPEIRDEGARMLGYKDERTYREAHAKAHREAVAKLDLGGDRWSRRFDNKPQKDNGMTTR